MNSISCNRILANNSNLAREALITASAQRPSTDIRLISSARTGGGRIVAQGSYTGAADTDIEVEVLTGTGGELTASTPIIDGVGSGALTITAIAPSAQPETLTFALLDAGSPPEPAELEFYGVTLTAVTPGAAGNALSLSVVRNLTSAPLQYATLERIAAGTDTLDGAEWDWGQPPATAAGIPAGALRIQFEGFPQIHRAWKVWDGGRFKYRIDPAVGWDIPADTRILAVTGDYTLTLTDGAAPETYHAVTLYDFLTAVEARSALAQVRGVVVRDTAPGGMAVTDIPLRTDAHALPAKMSVRSPHARQLADITVSPSAPTENITITRLPRTVGTGEAWSVRGGVSGDLPNASTGALYTAGPVQFRIPPIPSAGAAQAGARISATVHLTSRAEDEGDPALCFKPLVLGAAASDKSVTFTYRRRPPAECACEHLPALSVSNVCLGLDENTGGGMALDPEYQSRLQALYAWQSEFVQSNVGFSAAPAQRSDRIVSDSADITVARGCTGILASALAEIHESGLALAQWDSYFAQLQAELDDFVGLRAGASTSGRKAVTWAAGLTVSVGTLIRPSSPTGRLYLVVAAGMLDADNEPDWSSLTTSPITDGTAQLEILAPYWAPTTVFAEGAIAEPGNGYRYRATTGGTTGASEPYWATAGDVTDGGVTWSVSLASAGRAIVSEYERDVTEGGGSTANTTVTPAQIEVFESGAFRRTLVVTTGPQAGRTEIVQDLNGNEGELAAAVAARAAQMAVQYGIRETTTEIAESRQRTVRLVYEVEPYYEQYRVAMDHCRTIAGIVPKSDASLDAGACWRDYPDETHWWVDESGEYLPAFTNKPYVSAARDADGRPRSTQEFGFGVVTECEHRLKVGDRITITIRGTSGTDRDFGDGDTYIIPVIAAQAAPFTDGADGDPTHTWTVRGTVSGALPDWAWHPSNPDPYSAGPIDATLTAGGIPWEVGDSIRVALEGGTLRWRRDGGAWAESPIFGGAIAVGDGLQLVAHAGVAPSFVAGDTWHYRALATHGISRMRQPRIGQAFAWDDAAVQIDIDLGAAQPLECVLLGMHTLPTGAVITITGGLDAPDQFTVPAAHRPSVILAPLPPATTARHLRVTITGAGAGAAIGWLYAGTGWQPTVGASDLDIRRTYGLMRGAGLNPAALYRGRGEGGRWRWSIDDGGVLLDAALDALLALLDHVAAQGLEPVALVPDIRRPERTHLAILDTDEVPLTESMHWQTGTRAVSVELPFRAVLS